jgi:hypothetical protein
MRKYSRINSNSATCTVHTLMIILFTHISLFQQLILPLNSYAFVEYSTHKGKKNFLTLQIVFMEVVKKNGRSGSVKKNARSGSL